MNRLIKPKERSYTGEDSQVVAYSLACEIAHAAMVCTVVAGVGTLLTWLPPLAAATVACFITYTFTSAACI